MTDYVLEPAILASDLREMTLKDAIATWLPSRRGFIHPHTYRDYQYYSRRLTSLPLGDMVLKNIKTDHIRQYQSIRVAAGCGPYSINHECSMLQQILKRAGLWAPLEYDYQPLKLPHSTVGRALDDEEQNRLLRIAKSEPRWETVYIFMLISLNTSAGPGEVLSLRRKNIDLDKRVMFVNAEGAKNRYRIRPIPLNETAYNACEYTLKMAERKGSVEAEHFVFPFSTKGHKFDPTRHATTFKTAFDKIRIAAGLFDFRLYDLRHTAITRLYENPDNSEETIEQIAGHVGTAMKKRYAHVRMEAKRAALARLVPPRNERLIERLKGQEGKTLLGPLRTGKALTNNDVLEMIQAGIGAKVVAAKIQRCQTGGFDTSPEALKLLKVAGIPDAIILAMVEAE